MPCRAVPCRAVTYRAVGVQQWVWNPNTVDSPRRVLHACCAAQRLPIHRMHLPTYLYPRATRDAHSPPSHPRPNHAAVHTLCAAGWWAGNFRRHTVRVCGGVGVEIVVTLNGVALVVYYTTRPTMRDAACIAHQPTNTGTVRRVWLCGLERGASPRTRSRVATPPHPLPPHPRRTANNQATSRTHHTATPFHLCAQITHCPPNCTAGCPTTHRPPPGRRQE